jgi:hypothetical protein
MEDPLLGNDSETNNETTLVAKQQILNKQKLNNRGTVFSVRPAPRCYKQDNWSNESVLSCAGKDVSTGVE